MSVKPLKISWSGLRNHEECHQRSYLLREGKRAKVSNIRNFFPGTVVDSAMRVWLDSAERTRPHMFELVEETMVRAEAKEKEHGNLVRWRDPDDRVRVRTFCIDLVNKLEPLLDRHVLPYPYEHGKWFKVPMSIKDQEGRPREVLLTGEMDLLVQRPEGAVVFDLKGTADDQYYRKVIAQLVFYDLAVWMDTKVKTYGVGLIQPMCSEQMLTWQVTDEARRQLMVRIHRYAHDVWANERTCTDNRGACHWCDVKHACPRFSPANLDALGSMADAFRTAAEDAA